MEMIKIGTNGLKIIMSQSDMQKYEINNDTFDYADSETRRAFQSIMDDAKRKTGFDPEKRPLSVRFYPSKAGGCEIFVLHEENVKNFERLPTVKREDSAAAVYRFLSLETMICACRALHGCLIQPADAYYSDDGRFYLLLSHTANPRITEILDEYGKRISNSKISIYLNEHGKPIKLHNSIEYLGEL